MSNFSFIAVRPLKRCGERFLRNLTKEQSYIFHQAYQFSPENGDVNKITYYPERDIPLYSIKRKKAPRVKQPNDLTVSVSAVVGKNGSGKSNLFEFVFLAAYIIANKQGILEENIENAEEDLLQEQLKHNAVLEDDSGSEKIQELIEERLGLKPDDERLAKLQKRVNQHLQLFKDFAAEIFFRDDNVIKCLRIESGNRTLMSYANEDNSNTNVFQPAGTASEFKLDDSDLGRYFYTIVINYSLYGLNASKTGTWMKSLFHKNDGYQTPIVINPFRDNGVINVNSELHLAQSRLLANLMDETMSVKTVFKNKPLQSVIFALDKEQLKKVEGYDVNKSIKEQATKTKLTVEAIFFATYKALLDEEFDQNMPTDSIPNFGYITVYIFKKLLKIAIKYYPFRGYHLIDKDQEDVVTIKEINTYLEFLKAEDSHITLKLKQILNCVRYNLMEDDVLRKAVWKGDEIKIPIKLLEERLKAATNGKNILNPLEFMPTAFYRPSFMLTGRTAFHSLSSGEQHLVHTTQSVLYHLINLNTVFNRDGERTYQYVNIMLDEVELYFHPEYQKAIIDELLGGIARLHIPNIKALNIIFSTHSPFILSDIPDSHILRLDKGEPSPVGKATFGANIHDLLADSFFLQNGFMGDYAQRQIEAAVAYLNKCIKEIDGTVTTPEPFNRWNKENIPNLISIIGEPVLKQALEDAYYDLFQDKLEEEIIRLENKRRRQ